MPENLSKNIEQEQELDPITSFLSEWSDPEAEEEEFRSEFFQGLSGRRKKAAFTFLMICSVTVGLHLVSWGIWIILGIGIFVTLQAGRLMFAKAKNETPIFSNQLTEQLPTVSLLVAAKNEQAVIGNLVKMLFQLDYPQHKYEVLIVDDNSTDHTGIILDKLAKEYQQLTVIHRDQNATGGKSGALNQVFSLTKGDIIAVFDADAMVTRDLLQRVVPMFEAEKIGGVQVRKAIANYEDNFWTQGQGVEMALDAYFQQQRLACHGIGELRGNGQFVRRTALESCGGWNEETITDDLDLTIRLHLDRWDIGLLEFPPVEEEGVTTAISLWHQRNRWGEGGYQRYLDYWRFILSNRLSWPKKFDLLFFFFVQYILPTAAIPDLVMTIARHRLPLIAPLTSLTLTLAFWGMFTGLRRAKMGRQISLTELLGMAWQSLQGMIYMIHWFIVIPSVAIRMSIRPKRLKWVKTVHEGSSEENLGLEVN
jgi:1,2-diacylglycerol 3-beta-glucosyltransferase